MGTQKGRLFELARMYHTYQKKNGQKAGQPVSKKPVQVKGEHFDEEKSISLSYNLDMYPEVLYDSHQRQTPASQMSFFDSDKSEAFYVEPFDAEETVEVPYREVNEGDDDARLERIARGLSGDSEIESMEEDIEKMKDMEENLNKVFEPKGESSDMEVSNSESVDTKPQDTSAQPVTEKGESIPKDRNPDVKPYEASDEEFARDIGAILQGQKVYNAEQKKTVGRENEPDGRSGAGNKTGSPANTGAKTEDLLDPKKNEHMIFEKIAQSMAYANSYDLGSIALNKQFEMMDQEIEKEEVEKIIQERRGKGADDAEIIEEESTVGDKTGASAMGFEKYDPSGALDNHTGGRLIKENVLQKGDLILTSSSGAFDVIDGSIGAESIGGVYIGDNKILTKGDGGMLAEKQLREHLGNKGVMVALRHQEMSEEKASSIVNALTMLRPGLEKNQAENWIEISAPVISLHPDVCNAEGVSDKNRCNAYAGKIYLGTMSNDSFACAESIINAFRKNQVDFVPPLAKEHNGNLKYIGHLKNRK